MNEIIEDIVETLMDDGTESYVYMFEDYDYYENLTPEDKIMFDTSLTDRMNGFLGLEPEIEIWYYEDGAIGLWLNYKPIEGNVCVATLTPDSDVSPDMLQDFMNTYDDLYVEGTYEYNLLLRVLQNKLPGRVL